MGKKRRKANSNRAADAEHQTNLPAAPLTAPTGEKRPRVLFAVGDADHGYTEGKIWRLAQRLRDHTGWEVVGVTNDEEVAKAGKNLQLRVWQVAIESPGVSVEQRLWATDEMIRETADLVVPGSNLSLWKVLAMDDFLASLQLFDARPSAPLEADLVIAPLMCVDNNTKGSSGLYTWLVSQAHQQGIPVVGVEVSPLGNKNTFCHLPASRYAVKNEWARNFLIREGLAHPTQVSVLKWEEAYSLWSGQDEFAEAYLEKESMARDLLHIPADRFVVLIPHHVAFLWEVRKILQALAEVDRDWSQRQWGAGRSVSDSSVSLSVVIRVDSRTTRRQYPEREIVLKAYEKEIHALPHVVIDERVGVGLLLQLADLVISPFAGTTTERAVLCRKPTIICQALGEEGWQGEFLYWEPRPNNIPGLIQSWREGGFLNRTRLATLASTLLQDLVKAAA